jgi:spore maturation protein CgeB
MKIILTANKTYRGVVDTTWWYFYLPLKELGHEVHFYDTVNGESSSFSKLLESFKPDLIFCIMTGDRSIAPYEPWSEIVKESISGRTKTFNWFCDDTWRFDSFSKNVCHYFNVCSTPEFSYLEKYKNNGYNNIIEANWHCNSNFYSPNFFKNRKNTISFIGGVTPNRKAFFNSIKEKISIFSKISQEEMYSYHCDTKIGINLSTNDNDPNKKTQMKQRIFEVTAGGGMLMTEYHRGIENYYKIDKEIITFSSIDEFNKKIKFLLKNPKIIESIAFNGHNRFLSQHESKLRLSETLKRISEV